MIDRQDEDSTVTQPVMTIELIKQDAENAVYLPLPADAGPELLRAVSDAALSFAAVKNAEMFGIREGTVPAPAWAGLEGSADAHEEAEADWINGERRFEQAERLLGTPMEEINLRLERDANSPGWHGEWPDVARRDSDDLEARIAELAKMPGANDPLTTEAADLRRHILQGSMDGARTPEEGQALGRMIGAARQEFAAHLGTLAAISLDSAGQHEDATALRQEAADRLEIVKVLHMPPGHTPPDPTPPGASAPLPPIEPATGAADFRQDAEEAARSNGFGDSAQLVFMQSTTQETPAMQGTNPGIVFEEARASVAPGGNDYRALNEPVRAPETVNGVEALLASLRDQIAAPEGQQAEAVFDEPSPSRPQPTQTRALGVGNAPGGSFLHEYNQDLLTPAQHVQAAESELAAPMKMAAAYEDHGSLAAFPAAVKMEIEGDRVGVQEPGAALAAPGATIDTTARTVESAITAQAAEPTYADPLQALTDMLSTFKRGIETEGAGESNESSGQEQAASAFRSFGR